jgi:hypothetical protein
MASIVGYKPYLISTAKPAGFSRVSCQSPVNFSVYRGEVLEVQTNHLPNVYGSGRTFLGCGRSSVGTAIVPNTSVWTRDGTGQEKRWDLGELDLPMRPRHDVSLLWVNGVLYALHNRVTGQTDSWNFRGRSFHFAACGSRGSLVF